MGTCKASLTVAGKSMVQHIIETTSMLQQPKFLVGKSHQKKDLSIDGVHWIEDNTPARHPLYGVVAALKSAKTNNFDSALILPCDTPFVSLEGLQHLLEICPSVASDPSGSLHPLLIHLPITPIPINWLHRAQDHLSKHGSMKSFAQNIPSVRLSHTEVNNINRPSDIPQRT
jgi:molybdopterin-guanine dinucleotide biosynthesis protein A